MYDWHPTMGTVFFTSMGGVLPGRSAEGSDAPLMTGSSLDAEGFWGARYHTSAGKGCGAGKDGCLCVNLCCPATLKPPKPMNNMGCREFGGLHLSFPWSMPRMTWDGGPSGRPACALRAAECAAQPSRCARTYAGANTNVRSERLPSQRSAPQRARDQDLLPCMRCVLRLRCE